MINLLPTDLRQSLVYAKRNSTLRSWAFVLVAVNASLLLISAGGLLFLKNSTKSFESQVEQGRTSLSEQNQEEIKAQVQDLTSSLKLVDQVLSKEVLFSKLLSAIGAAMPAGSVLTNLSINELEGGLDLQAAATDYETGTQVQVNLSDVSNGIFQSADIVSIQCSSGEDASSPLATAYPCNVRLRALFADNNPFLFINSDSEAQQ